MDYTFLMFVFSVGFLIGSYFIYWHLENIINASRDRITDDVEELFTGLRTTIREEFDVIKESLEKCKIECSKMKVDIGYIRDHIPTLIPPVRDKEVEYKPARKTAMKTTKEKSSSGDGE